MAAAALGGPNPRADELHILSCAIGCDEPVNGVVTRVLPGRRRCDAAATQTLLSSGSQLRPLSGADAHSGLKVGPPLQLYAEHPAPSDGGPAAARRPHVPRAGFRADFRCPVWDPSSSAVYMGEEHAIVRLSNDDTVTLVAGDVDQQGAADGPGRAARFSFPQSLVSDGAGSLYLAQGTRIRRLQLSGAALRVPQAAAGVGPVPAGSAAGEAPGEQAAAAAAEGEVLVSTLPWVAAGYISGLAYDGGSSSSSSSSSGKASGRLLYTTRTALYRLPLGDPAAVPSLVAGAEGVKGSADGLGANARFNCLCGIVLDGEGCTYVADYGEDAETTTVRRVAADGTVDTLAPGIAGCYLGIAILPNGCLALSIREGLHVLSLGLLPPPAFPAAPAPTGPPPRTLPGDLGALLSRQPDGTADVTIVVGGRTFHVHRALLSARCDYFQPRLGGEFADGSAQELDLPDADPDAFEVVLLFVYTGTADIPDVLAAGVAELADRLLLPELCEQAATVVEVSVSARTVAGLLLWAEARGPSFAGLLSRLKGWYVENHEAVMREAKEQVAALLAQSPGLALELMGQLRSSGPSKRPRTH